MTTLLPKALTESKLKDTFSAAPSELRSDWKAPSAMVRGKKAQIEDLVEFVFAAMLMGVLLLVATVIMNLTSLPGGLELKGKITGTVEDFTPSKACDYYVMNMLRTESGNVTFAEKAAYVKTNPGNADSFKANVTKFMADNYRRYDNVPGGIWQISLSSGVTKPFLVFGNLTVIDVMDTCSKTIPSLGGGEPLIVRLALTE